MKCLFLTLTVSCQLMLLPLWGQKDTHKVKDERQAYRVALGRSLFRSPHLSGKKQMTCATCHEPSYSFTDGVAESPGILGTGVGRNSPTMFAIAHVPQFPGPRLANASPLKSSQALTLAERCLVPIENPLEMASSVKDAIGRLKNSQGMKASFERAYGPGILGITAKRVGEALAAYLSTIEAPNSPYRNFLAGDQNALSTFERRGLKIFQGGGQCAHCHSGEALSDGLLHTAFLPGSARDVAQSQRGLILAAKARRSFANMKMQLPETGIGRELFDRLAPQLQGCDATMSASANRRTTYDGQDPSFKQMHTLSLWDVARTGPYFRDGSVATLEQTIQTHVSELRQVRANWKRVRNLRKQANRRAGSKTAKRLLPKWIGHPKGVPTPDDLTAGDLQAVLAFLKTLSPRS